MGMFDSVWLNCPHCGQEQEIQTKDGPCLLKNWHISDVPVGIAESLDGREETCWNCSKLFKITMPPMQRRVAMIVSLVGDKEWD